MNILGDLGSRVKECFSSFRYWPRESVATTDPQTGFYMVRSRGEKTKRIQDPRTSRIYSVLLYTLTDSTIIMGTKSGLL